MIITIYFIFLVVSIFSFLQFSEKKSKILFSLVFSCLFLYATLRDGNLVRDYESYIALHVDLRYNDNSEENVEITFNAISWLVRHLFGNNIVFLFAIYALLGVGIKYIALKKLTSLLFLSTLIYISEFFILHELTQIRVGVACAILLISVDCLYNHNLKKFIIFSICAIFFHFSAIIFIPLWFIKSNNINKKFYAMIIPFAYLVYFSNVNIFEVFINLVPIEYVQKKFEAYKHFQNQGIAYYSKINVFNKVFISKCIIFYVLLWKSKLIEEKNKYVNIFLKIEALSLSSFILLSTMPIFAFRISQMLGIVEIVLFPCLYYAFKPKYVSNAIVIIIGLCMLLITIFYNDLIKY